MEEHSFNFIIGKANSGTTLLMTILNSHPFLQATPEVNFFVFFYDGWKHKDFFEEDDYRKIELFLSKFKNRRYANAFSWDMSIFKSNIEKQSHIDFEIIYQCFYSAFTYAGVTKKFTHNFDKNPSNTLFLDDLVSQFSKSKFIYITRDPRANYLSRKEKLNKKHSNIYKETHLWKIFNKEALKVIDENKDRFYLLKYEDFVSDPEFYLREIAKFFNFSYDDRMLGFYLEVEENNIKKIAKNYSEVSEQAKRKYSKLSRPINTDRVSEWKEKLNKEDIEIISRICHLDDYKHNQAASINFFEYKMKYIKGLCAAKKEVIKNKIIYYLPLLIKLKLIKPI